MKYLKEFKLFESVEAEIHDICKEYRIKNYTINPDGSIDVNSINHVSLIVDLERRNLTKIPLNFNKVTGSFFCNDNQLTSLEGAPKEVGADFYCEDSQLTSLEGAPDRVGRDFNCYRNQLTSLLGSPKEVGRDFMCSNNLLTSLEGAPERVVGDFYCNSNQLTSLLGAPKEVGGGFYCENNQLTSLEGAPDRVGGDFYCYNNKIMNIDGLLWKSFKNIYLSDNPVYPIVGSWINNDNHEELIEYFIDLNVIQDDRLIMERLRAFHEEMYVKMEIDFKEVGKYYTIIK